MSEPRVIQSKADLLKETGLKNLSISEQTVAGIFHAVIDKRLMLEGEALRVTRDIVVKLIETSPAILNSIIEGLESSFQKADERTNKNFVFLLDQISGLQVSESAKEEMYKTVADKNLEKAIEEVKGKNLQTALTLGGTLGVTAIYVWGKFVRKRNFVDFLYDAFGIRRR